jgi:energy-coupling factor transporter ATP-binding protein EcfA2
LTLLVGQNNSGKTSILRFLALLFNKAWSSLDEFDVPVGGQLPIFFTVKLKSLLLSQQLDNRSYLRQIIQFDPDSDIILNGSFTKDSFVWDFDESIFDTVPKAYFQQNVFQRDGGTTSSNVSDNIAQFKMGFQSWLGDLAGSVYVPSLRFIAEHGTSVRHFGQREFPGDIVEFSIINKISQLQSFDGTGDQRAKARQQLISVENFVAHCLEKQSVSFSVSDSKNNLFVTIDGKEQNIGNLGSGVQQLILLGMASFAFPRKLVLIDEPELHFHPRTQKLLLRYIVENSSSNLVIATHSAAVIDAADGAILHIDEKWGKTTATNVGSNAERFEAIRNLGHSPSELVQANFVLWVEGPSDRIYFLKWISLVDPELVEGVDFSILFYGGSNLASHGFEHDADDFVKSLSVCRQFAVDSELKTHVKRVVGEVVTSGGISWISAGREIENYVPNTIITELSNIFSGVSTASGEFERILDASKCEKVKFAKAVVERWADEWPLDLEVQLKELVKAINAAK